MRTALKLFAAVITVVVLAIGGFAAYIAWSFANASIDTIGEVDFDRPLAIPPLAKSTVDARGVRTFDLAMQAGETDLGRGAKTPTWGFNGSFLKRPQPPRSAPDVPVGSRTMAENDP